MVLFNDHDGVEVVQFPCLSDNYGFLVHDPATGATAAIDTPDADGILTQLEARGWTLSDIWNTHHHWDHTGGNEALKARTGALITGPAAEEDRIPAADRLVSGGDQVSLGGLTAQVIDVPGHTSGHIAYHFADQGIAFVGDTLFAMGCGRLFEGTPAQMWASLSRLRTLPPETVIYCAHEYTEANGRFALSVDNTNEALVRRMEKVRSTRAAGDPTVPTTIEAEIATNPFLRADQPSLAAATGKPAADPVAVFAEIRRRKDSF